METSPARHSGKSSLLRHRAWYNSRPKCHFEALFPHHGGETLQNLELSKVLNRRSSAAVGLIVIGALFMSTCTRSGRQDAKPTAAVSSTTNPSTFGPMVPVVSVKELMQYMIDPISDDIFDAVWWDTTKNGVVKHQPTTDEDWEKVKTGAISLAEGIFLLKVPRPFAPDGDVNNSLGPNPPELSPIQIKAKLEKDPVLWEAKIQAMRNAALEIVDVVKKKNADELFVASQDIDEACENCHLEYWYPGDAASVEAQKHARVTFGTSMARGGDPNLQRKPR
jgi:hypothetical protein